MKKWVWIGFCLSFIIIFATAFLGTFWGNIGLLNLIAFILSPAENEPEAEVTRLQIPFEQSLFWNNNLSNARRGLGFSYWLQEQDEKAFYAWLPLNFTAIDYITYGKQSSSSNEALRWYQLAEKVDPTNHELWVEVGQICQQNPNQNEICSRWLTANDQNWLVDPFFTFNHRAWRFNRYDNVWYAIESCPDLPEQQCATIRVDTSELNKGVSWLQCLVVKPNTNYQFSAWLKVESTDEQTTWRPLYFQGKVDGEPWGRSMGTRNKSIDWTHLTYTLTTPQFDDDKACFQPLVLFGPGQSWISGTKLKEVSNE